MFRGLSIGEMIGLFTLSITFLMFLFKNFKSFQDNTEAIAKLEISINKMNSLLEELKIKNINHDIRIDTLEDESEKMNNRITYLERKMKI